MSLHSINSSYICSTPQQTGAASGAVLLLLSPFSLSSHPLSACSQFQGSWVRLCLELALQRDNQGSDISLPHDEFSEYKTGSFVQPDK